MAELQQRNCRKIRIFMRRTTSFTWYHRPTDAKYTAPSALLWHNRLDLEKTLLCNYSAHTQERLLNVSAGALCLFAGGQRSALGVWTLSGQEAPTRTQLLDYDSIVFLMTPSCTHPFIHPSNSSLFHTFLPYLETQRCFRTQQSAFCLNNPAAWEGVG